MYKDLYSFVEHYVKQRDEENPYYDIYGLTDETSENTATNSRRGQRRARVSTSKGPQDEVPSYYVDGTPEGASGGQEEVPSYYVEEVNDGNRAEATEAQDNDVVAYSGSQSWR